jgi:chromate transporter
MRERSPPEVLLAFLKLGSTSFGGPIAHLGYFRAEFVERRRWLDDAAYTDLVALCQFLPGPGSSQVAFALGLNRAGYLGGIAAWLGFTLPSAVLMTAFAFGAHGLDGPRGQAALHGLELVAVSVVAQAVLGMARTSCPDRQRVAIACAGAVLMLAAHPAFAQIATLLLGGLAGLWLCREAPAAAGPAPAALPLPVSRRAGLAALAAFVVLLGALPLLGTRSPTARFCDAFYRAGALVFGGGHVVLPLLNAAFVEPGWVSARDFLAGYGAAQAVPGPVFTVAAYLGAIAGPVPRGAPGAALGLSAIFLPGVLILLGALPFWQDLRRRGSAQAAMRGVNAAVVGLLAAALYQPLGIHAVGNVADVALVLFGWILLALGRLPPLLVVLLGALGGIARA